MSDDASHITAPPENGEGAAMAMRHALSDAGIAPSDVGYINTHGTSTQRVMWQRVARLRVSLVRHGGKFHQIDDRSSTGRCRWYRSDFHPLRRYNNKYCHRPSIWIIKTLECKLDYVRT